MCLCDLQKVLNSVDFPVLLERLFDAGVNSKTAVVYPFVTQNVKVQYLWGRTYLPHLLFGRGVRQGSILSPALITALLRQLPSLFLGAMVNNIYAGAFLRAEDICTLASNSISSIKAQVAAAKKFTKENFLKLNAAKCEVIIFRKCFVKG